MKRLLPKILLYISLISILTFCSCIGVLYFQYKSADYHILVDFSIPSTRDRFFVYDNSGELIFKCRCAHGPGNGSTSKVPVFSNRIGSQCSSLGRYIIFRKEGSRQFPGGSIGLMGISHTNYNAWRRGILIHGGLRNYPSYIPMNPKISAGCFTIPSFRMKQLIKLLGEDKSFSLKAFVK